jgi:ribosomal protein S27E
MRVEVLKTTCPKCGNEQAKQNKYHHPKKPATMSKYVKCPVCGNFDSSKREETKS